MAFFRPNVVGDSGGAKQVMLCIKECCTEDVHAESDFGVQNGVDRGDISNSRLGKQTFR